MSERKYTVSEIDKLRRACGDRWLFGTTNPVNAMSRQYFGSEKDEAVEAQLRTYMLAGITAEDIYEEDKPKA